jgi:uncharacterized membrane protein
MSVGAFASLGMETGMLELMALAGLLIAVLAMFRIKDLNRKFEREISALREEVGRLHQPPAAALDEVRAEDASTASDRPSAAAETVAGIDPSMQTAPIDEASAEDAAPEPVQQPAMPAAARESLESRLAGRWSVWVGGIALAFAGVFAVKYSIEQGLLSPAVRLTLAALFGLVLVAAGEWVRRRTTPLVQSAFQNALIPGVLTAAGSLTLLGAVFVAHAVYFYIGPGFAFFLLAVVSLTTLALALIHGQGLAGLGLLASFATPVMVESDAPSPWFLFGFLSIVWLSNACASRMRNWRVAPALANAGLSLWCLAHMVFFPMETVFAPGFAMLVMIAGMALVWPGQKTQRTNGDKGTPRSAWELYLFPSHGAAVLIASLGILVNVVAILSVDAGILGAEWIFVMLVVALALLGAGRRYAAYAAIISALAAFGGIRAMAENAVSTTIDAAGESYHAPFEPDLVIGLAFGLGLVFVLLGGAVNWRLGARLLPRSVLWSGLAAITPLALAGLSFFFLGNYAFDLWHGVYGLLMAVLHLIVAWRLAQSIDEGRYHINRDVWAAASWASLLFALVMLTEGAATTLGAAMIGFGYLMAQRVKPWPILPWAMAASAIFVAGRIAWQPTIVGAGQLGHTPVFNALLVGYGGPALLLILSAWMTRKSADVCLRSVLEALASLFTLLTLGVLVRHAMNGGVLDSSVPTLSEQAIYTLLTIGASATLMALDLRQPSSVFRTGSMAVGYISMLSVLSAHFFGLNPYFTGEPTGRIPVFNLLFLAYLLPGLAYGAAAHYARTRRPLHYVMALALTGSALLFGYVTLSVRRIYHGADISDWKGFLQPELYTYSAVWLVLAAVLLAIGYRFRVKSIRLAAAGLMLVVVLKVFLIDMGNLEGLFRVLSFVGLGVVLIAIGRFYQTILGGLQTEGEQPSAGAVYPAALKPVADQGETDKTAG